MNSGFWTLLLRFDRREGNEDLAERRQLNTVGIYKGEVLYFLPLEPTLYFVG